METLMVSIVIVNYNVKELVLKCISSVLNSELMNAEVIVVDNNSSDESVKAIKQLFPKVIVIDNKDNKGFSAANNQGIFIAKGKYILLLNPDTEVQKKSLQKMIEFMKNNSSQIILAPQLLNSDGSLQISAWRFPSVSEIILETFYIHRLFRISEYHPNIFQDTFKAEGLSGAAMMFSKETINKTGMMDENLFWMEDIDLCYRNKKSGGMNIYFPEAKIIHHTGASAKQNFRITISNQLLSKLKFFKKHYGLFSMIFASIFILIHIFFRIIVLFLLSPFSKTFRLKSYAYIFSLLIFFKYIFTGNKSVAR
ncbi:MAG: glycosyltransferase family 2 protein [Bacteroidota bacterium]